MSKKDIKSDKFVIFSCQKFLNFSNKQENDKLKYIIKVIRHCRQLFDKLLTDVFSACASDSLCSTSAHVPFEKLHWASQICYHTGMLVPTLARVYRSSVGMLYLKILDANVGFSCYLSIEG